MLVENLSIFLLVLLCGNACVDAAAARTRVTGRGRAARECSYPKLINGIVIKLFRGKMIRFDCNKSFYRMGERYAECMNGRWSVYSFPICIKAGCAPISSVENGKISYMNRNVTAMLFCEPNYEIVGSTFAHCNGTDWDRAIGTCKETDNTPPLSCDFERDAICGWQHDADHDFDFERRSGYNNRTISILTGPSADHTIGIPFQGHYMVINTNADVYTKSARLISPLYRLNAQKLCFQFYYHMYGMGVGTLRVYAKPESVELTDILVNDEVLEAQNDYLVFEVKGTQGNLWKKGNGTIKQFNESFQIIVEAISGQTRLSDIAFDDVSILTDQDCSNESDDDNEDGNDAKDTETREDEDGGILNVESCVNRCFEEVNATVHLYANKTLSCLCSNDCDLRTTCCPDYIDVCMSDSSQQNKTLTTALPETIIFGKKNRTTSTTSRSTTTILPDTTTTRRTTTSRAILPETTTSRYLNTTTSSTTERSTTSLSSSPSTQSLTTTKLTTTTLKVALTTEAPQVPQNSTTTMQQESDFGELPKNSDEIEDEHEIKPEEMQQHENPAQKSSSFIVTILVIVAVSLCLAFIALKIVYKQYRKSTNPLNYKEKSECTLRADEEFSEIRYLTSDETLDFSLITPDNASDL